MREARGAVGVALVATLVAWPAGPAALAVDSGDPVRIEDFESGLVEWTATGAAPGSWTTVLDLQSPSPAKTVLRNTDIQSAAHAIFWSTVSASTTFGVRASVKGHAGGAWIGVTFGHDVSPDRYVAARVQVGARTAELVRFPEGQVLASGQIPGSGGCGPDPVVPTGQYVTVEVQQSLAGVADLFYNNMKLVSVQLPPDLLGGGHPGAYYAGGGASFEDLRLQSPDLPTISDALVSVDAGTSLGPVPEDFAGAFMVWLASANGFNPAVAGWDDLRDSVERLHQVFPQVADMGLRTLRFPGGTLANQYRWKEHIGNYLTRPPSAELSLDEFMRVAESLGARAVLTVNASDEIAGGAGTFEGAREAADLVEYLTAPDDGSNPDPDGLAPDDPANVDWARERARNGHRSPYDVAGFEVGNELRGLPYLDGDPASTAYANRFIEFAGAMKAVNPAILVGAVGKDNENDPQYAPWYEDVSARLQAADCDWLPGDGTDVDCADFWIKHVYVPNYNIGSGDSIGVVFDSTTVAIERDFEVAGGAPVRLWFAAFAAGSTGALPLLRVQIDDGAALDQTVLVDNGAPLVHPAWQDMGLYDVGPATLAPGTHRIRLTRTNTGRSLLLVPIVAVADDAAGVPASWTDALRVDLRDGTVLGRLEHAMATTFRSRILAPGATAPGELYGLPLWVTEISPSYEAVNIHMGVPESDYYVPPMDPEVGALREMLLDANLHMVMLDESVGHSTTVQLFDDRLGAGLIEGVGIDTHHGGEVGWNRIGSALPPRLRPRGWLQRAIARHWRGDRVAVEVSSPTYTVAATGITFGKVGGETLDDIPYVRGVATHDAAAEVVTVTLTNTHASQAIDATVDLGTFTPGATVEITTIGGGEPDANNEPEADVCSHPGPTPEDPCALGVVPSEATLAVPGPVFTISLPPSSLTFVRVPAAGADVAPPAAPTSLAATGDPLAGGVALDWQWSGGEPVTFDVYRSLHWEPSDRTNEDPTDTTPTACLGPWGHRLNAAPLATPAFVDTTVDPGDVYCYGVRAVDAAGNESDPAVLRHRGTTADRLVVESVALNPGATILYGSTIDALVDDLLPVDGQVLSEDFLVLRPELSQQIPPVGRNLDAVFTTEPFAGDPAALLGLDLVVSFRFKTPLFVPHAEISIRDFAAGGTWESVVSLDPIGTFSKTTRAVRRLDAARYLSPEGRVEIRFDTNAGDPYAELFVEHIKVVMESL